MTAHFEESVEWGHQRRHEPLHGDVPLRPITISGDYAPLAAEPGIVMMASDWIPTEPPSPVPLESNRMHGDAEEYERQLQKLDRIVPDWAATPSSSSLAKTLPASPTLTDAPLR